MVIMMFDHTGEKKMQFRIPKSKCQLKSANGGNVNTEVLLLYSSST